MACRYAPLASQDLPAVVQHLLDLEHDDRVLRFNCTAPDSLIREYCARWDFAADVVEAAWDDERLVGVVHIPVFPAGADRVGELGVSVERAWRKRRIATRLTERAFERGRGLGVDRIYVFFLTRNRPMLCLTRRFTDEIAIDGDESVATIRLRPQARVAATGR